MTATTSIGLLISTFTSSQVAAVFVMGSLWPTTYYMHASVGAFTKGLHFDILAADAIALALFIPVLLVATAAALRKQEL